MIITIKSDNPKLSYVLRKRPETILGKPIRKGTSFAWYNNGFHMVFLEGADEVSYPEYRNHNFQYNLTSHLVSSLCALNLLWEYLKDSVKKECKEDVVCYNEITITNLLTQTRVNKVFGEHFEDINLEVTPNQNWKKYATVKISSESRLKDLLVYTNLYLIATVQHRKEEFVGISSDLIAKYIVLLNMIDTPYFVRYIFKTMLCHNPKYFKKFKPFLETENIKMTFGNTWQQRMGWILKHVDKNDLVLDFGCGEGKFADKFKNYIGYDINSKLLEKVKKKNPNKTFIDNLSLLVGEPDTIICSEVIEHNQPESVFSQLKSLSVSKIIITTPNVEFNKNYLLGDNLRHEEHEWELTSGEFQSLVDYYFDDCLFEKEFYGIGDIVNGITPTQGVSIQKLGELR